MEFSIAESEFRLVERNAAKSGPLCLGLLSYKYVFCGFKSDATNW